LKTDSSLVVLQIAEFVLSDRLPVQVQIKEIVADYAEEKAAHREDWVELRQ